MRYLSLFGVSLVLTIALGAIGVAQGQPQYSRQSSAPELFVSRLATSLDKRGFGYEHSAITFGGRIFPGFAGYVGKSPVSIRRSRLTNPGLGYRGTGMSAGIQYKLKF